MMLSVERPSCADPGSFAEGWGGGGEVKARLPENVQLQQRSFFLVLNLFYSFTVVYQWFISMKTIVFQVSEGVQHFPRGGGGPTFSRGGVLHANLYRNPWKL